MKNLCHSLMHNIIQSGRTFGEKNHLVVLFKYLLTCDHFVKVYIKGLSATA